MSELGTLMLGWWGSKLRPRDDPSSARGLRARLRRAGSTSEILSEPLVAALALSNRYLANKPDRLARLVQVLADVERHDPKHLAQILGDGDPPVYSNMRFQRLIRTPDGELPTALRRALPMAGYRCNVATLAEDIWNWGDAARGESTRVQWCLKYFRAAPMVLAADNNLEEAGS